MAAPFDALELVLIHRPDVPPACEIDCLQQFLKPDFAVHLEPPAEGEVWEPAHQRMRVRSANETFENPQSIERSVRGLVRSNFRLHSLGAIRRPD